MQRTGMKMRKSDDRLWVGEVVKFHSSTFTYRQLPLPHRPFNFSSCRASQSPDCYGRGGGRYLQSVPSSCMPAGAPLILSIIGRWV